MVVPNGSDRVDDAVAFMKFILSDNEQVEGYAKLLNLTTRSDMADNKYFQAEPLVQDVAKALEVGTTPYTLTFFEQINSPQGPGCRCSSGSTTPTTTSTRSSRTAKARPGRRVSCQVWATRIAERRSTAAAVSLPRPARHRGSLYSGGWACTRRAATSSSGCCTWRPRCCSCWLFTAYPLRPHGLGVVQQLDPDHATQVHRLSNYFAAFDDEQYWVSLSYTLEYTLLITPILMVGGYLIALLVVGQQAGSGG